MFTEALEAKPVEIGSLIGNDLLHFKWKTKHSAFDGIKIVAPVG
jgi:hypothetical protein